MHATRQEFVSIRTRQEQLKEIISVQMLRKDEIEAKIIHLNNNIHFLQPDADERAVELKAQEIKITQLNQDLQTQNELLNTKSNDFNQKNLFYYQLKNQLATLDQEINFKEQNASASSKRLEKNISEKQNAEEDLKNLLESNEIQEDQLIDLYTEKESISLGLTEAENEYYQGRGEIDKLEKDVRELQKARENSDALLMEFQTILNEARLQLISVQERLSVEFEVNLDQLQLIPDEEEDKILFLPENEIRNQAHAIKLSMEKIGAINPLALEAYEEMKERSDFITSQKQDLVEAKNSLLNTISEIELVAKETFLTAFANIRTNFIKVFRSLFSDEDSCDLKLVDENNPLESAIDIIAKPRGKKPLTINQLSGGGKNIDSHFAFICHIPYQACAFLHF